MNRPLSLPDFEAPVTGGTIDPVVVDQPAATEASEEDRLAVFDQGYRSGWDDCAAAEAEERGHIGADLAANLRDLSAEYAAMRQDVLTALGPLFDAVIGRLLPEIAAAAVAPVVRDELLKIAQDTSAAMPEVIAAPSAIPMLERLVETMPELETRLRPEPAYAHSQVSIRFATERRDIDLDNAVREMTDAIRGFIQGTADRQDEGETSPEMARKGAA